jgi:hypothetical protein
LQPVPDESLNILNKTTADTAGGTQTTASPKQRSDAAERLQAIFDSIKGGEGVNAANEAQRAYDRWSQHLHEDLTQLAKDLDYSVAKLRGDETAPMGLMQAQKAAAEAVAREVTAKGLEGRQIPGDERRAEEAKGRLPAGQFAASEAKMEAREERESTRHKEEGRSSDFRLLPSSSYLPPPAPGAPGELERTAATTEAGERAGAKSGGGRALTQQERDALRAGDQVGPAMKALLVEVAKMQDQHVNGLKRAVDVIAGTSETVDGLVGLMRTIAARQQQLQSDQSAMAQQLAAWARTTQIP